MILHVKWVRFDISPLKNFWFPPLRNPDSELCPPDADKARKSSHLAPLMLMTMYWMLIGPRVFVHPFVFLFPPCSRDYNLDFFIPFHEHPFFFWFLHPTTFLSPSNTLLKTKTSSCFSSSSSSSDNMDGRNSYDSISSTFDGFLGLPRCGCDRPMKMWVSNTI